MPLADKKTIIKEIQKTAATNGGTPLGQLSFENETGIRRHEWKGVYWIRWSDAVREAGFSPNVRSLRIDDSELLDSLAKFIRELGRFPIDAEIRMRRRLDKSFPSLTTLSRFGGKKALSVRIRQYCKQVTGYDDVDATCAQIKWHENENDEPDFPARRVEYGSVYLLKSGRRFKIGKTNAFGRRERELSIQLPEKPSTVHVIKTDDPDGVERYWHSRFADKREGGEWFKLTADDVVAFKRWKRIW